MEKEFIPYTEALALKELGFDEPCMGVYYGDEDDIQFVLDVRETQYYAQKGYKNGMLAPIYSAAFRWFRENHKLLGQVNICTYFIYDMSNHDGFHTTLEMVKQYDELCDNYEEAELECLKKLIGSVKK